MLYSIEWKQSLHFSYYNNATAWCPSDVVSMHVCVRLGMCVCVCLRASVENFWIIHEVVKMTSRQRESSFTSISHSVSSSLSQPSIIDEKQGATWLSQQHSNRANPVGMVTREQITSNCWPNHVSNTTGPLRVAVSAYTRYTENFVCFFFGGEYETSNFALMCSQAAL